MVIVNWNAGTHLHRCLVSLTANPPSGSWEAIVVDNASSDGSLEFVERDMPGVRVIRNRRGRALAAANNQGILASTGDVIVISNPDVEFRPGALADLVDALDRHHRAAFVEPRLLHPDGTLQTSAGDQPRLWEAVVGRWVLRRLARPGGTRGFTWAAWSHDQERLVGRAGDACFAARRAAVVEVGLEDEAFPLDWEAIDWSARAVRAGWEIWFCPASEVVHHAGTSTTKASPARWVIATHRGMYRYFRNRRPAYSRPFLAGIFGVRAGLKLLAVYAHLPMSERLRGAEIERGVPPSAGVR